MKTIRGWFAAPAGRAVAMVAVLVLAAALDGIGLAWFSGAAPAIHHDAVRFLHSLGAHR